MNYPAKYTTRVMGKAIKLYGYRKPWPQVKLRTVTQPCLHFSSFGEAAWSAQGPRINSSCPSKE